MSDDFAIESTEASCPYELGESALVGRGTAVDIDAFEDLLLCDISGMSRGKQLENRGCEMPC